MPYIRKTVDVLISDELRKVLEVIESESLVAHLLLKKRHSKELVVENPINYISISTTDKNKISYLNQDRINNLVKDGYDEYEFWQTSKRYQAKPGAFVTKIFKDIPAKEVEKFSNLFKAESNKEDFNFIVVNGDQIRDYYHWERHESDRGTLGVSCMKHDSCQKYFNVYTENTDNVSMLVMLNSEGGVKGRSLLWNFGTNKIMDRIYSTDDEKLHLYFKKWATENGYLYKSEQNWYNTLFFENMNTSKKEIKLELDLPHKLFKYYPYLDTFKFIDNNGVLYNYIPKDTSIQTLCSTDGSKHESDYLRFDSIDKVYRYRGESIYVNYMDFYTSERNVVWSEVNDQYILRQDAFYDEEISDYIFKKELNDKNNLEKIKDRRKWMEERNEKRKSKKKISDESIMELSGRLMDIFTESSSIPHHYFNWRYDEAQVDIPERANIESENNTQEEVQNQEEVDFSEPN